MIPQFGQAYSAPPMPTIPSSPMRSVAIPMQQRYSSFPAQPAYRPPAQFGFSAPAPYDYTFQTAQHMQVQSASPTTALPMPPPAPRPVSLAAAALAAARNFTMPVVPVVPGADEKDYVPKGLFFASDAVLLDSVSIQFQFDLKADWNKFCKCPRSDKWADNILTFTAYQRDLFKKTANKSLPPKDERLSALYSQCWTDEFDKRSLNALCAAFLADNTPKFRGLSFKDKVAALEAKNVPLISWDYFDGLISEAYSADPSDKPVIPTPVSLARAEHAYINAILKPTDEEFDAAFPDGVKIAQPVPQPGPPEGIIQPPSPPIQQPQSVQPQPVSQAQLFLQSLPTPQHQAQALFQPQPIGQPPPQPQAHLPYYPQYSDPAALEGYPHGTLPPLTKHINKLVAALQGGLFFWPPNYRRYVLEKMTMAATDPDSMKLKLGADGCIQMDSSSQLPQERLGGQAAWDDFKDGFAEVITLMGRLGFPDATLADRRDWLNFVDRDTGISANAKLAASRIFIQQFCGQPLWSPCISANPTIWLRSFAGTLPTLSRSGEEGDNQHSVQQNNRQNQQQNNQRNNNRNNRNNQRNQNRQNNNQNNRNNFQGNNRNQSRNNGHQSQSYSQGRKRSSSRSRSPRRGAPARRSRSASRSPPKRITIGTNSRPSYAPPNRNPTVCDSRTHRATPCAAERDGRACKYSHVCQNGCADSHPLSRCPKA